MSVQHSPNKISGYQGSGKFPWLLVHSLYSHTFFFLGNLDIVESTTRGSVLESLLGPACMILPLANLNLYPFIIINHNYENNICVYFGGSFLMNIETESGLAPLPQQLQFFQKQE